MFVRQKFTKRRVCALWSWAIYDLDQQAIKQTHPVEQIHQICCKQLKFVRSIGRIYFMNWSILKSGTLLVKKQVVCGVSKYLDLSPNVLRSDMVISNSFSVTNYLIILDRWTIVLLNAHCCRVLNRRKVPKYIVYYGRLPTIILVTAS